MSTNERLLKLATASPAVLAKVDAVLNGADAANRSHDENVTLLTITETAKKLGISRPTTYRLLESGRLETVQLNGVRRVRLASVLNFVNGKGGAR